MIKSIFGIALYLIKIIRVFGVQQVISTTFQGNSFSDPDNLVASGAQLQFTDCSGKRLFRGFLVFGRVSVTKTFVLPRHSSINLQLDFWNIDSWYNEYGYIFVDYQLEWQIKQNYYYGTQI